MIKKRYSIILIIIGIIFSLLSLVVPFLTKYLIDEAVNLSNETIKEYDKLIFFIIIIVIFTILAINYNPTKQKLINHEKAYFNVPIPCLSNNFSNFWSFSSSI